MVFPQEPSNIVDKVGESENSKINTLPWPSCELEKPAAGKEKKLGTDIDRKIAPIISCLFDKPPFTEVRLVFENGPYDPYRHLCTQNQEQDPSYLYRTPLHSLSPGIRVADSLSNWIGMERLFV
ncbi:hypothetical protein AVEN_125710-1 [Araneus ventricosus]|uniref:Uncharacterized protein n=1 Tax=Araneus ventricosus TaxID=182803 RepID=A0A4Y2D840_ARAVE|nr:hypothetical protein AVEN_19502-1 [Araneus ventricosus]GBM12962.1 hypothetical protein AVEN_125710-1 [Araneus ventricosus]